MTGKLQDMSEDLEEMKRPSLTKIILSLTTPAKQQEALGHMQTALQIAYARYIVRTHVYIHVHVFSGHVLRCTYIHVSMEAAIIHVHMIKTSMLNHFTFTLCQATLYRYKSTKEDYCNICFEWYTRTTVLCLEDISV